MMTVQWNRAEAAHTLRRVGFGARPEDLDTALEAGRFETIANSMLADSVDPILDKGLPGVLALENIHSLAAWWMARLLDNGAPFRERVALMWHNHFATSQAKVRDARLMHAQIQLLRKHGSGDFRVLLHKIARDPAMLLWLDGNENRLGSPNENFAREVLELFAIGIGNYTETDVKEAARAFTGWGVDRRRFVFRERHHDGGEKHVLGKRAAFGGDAVLDSILQSPHCPRWIARRLLTEFAHPYPTEEEITTWSKVLLAQDWNIGKTLERLFASDLFLSPRMRRSRIASPVELIVGASLSLGIQTVPSKAAQAASDMGQTLYQPGSVKGWEGGRNWIHAGTWLTRHNYLVALAHQAVDEGLDWDSEMALSALMPENAPAGLRQAVEAEIQGNANSGLSNAIALILTTPEAQLV